MIVRVWMAPSLGVWVGPSWSYRWRRQAVSMRASGLTSGEEQEGGCMQGRGRRDEDVDDEAVHDDVACAPPWSCKTCETESESEIDRSAYSCECAT